MQTSRNTCALIKEVTSPHSVLFHLKLLQSEIVFCVFLFKMM